MEAYAEGFNILAHANAGAQARPGDAETVADARSRPLPVHIRPAGDRRTVAPRKRHRIVAARSDRASAGRTPGPSAVFRTRLRFRRRTLDRAGRHRKLGARARADDGAVPAVQLAAGRRLLESPAVGAAPAVRRPSRIFRRNGSGNPRIPRRRPRHLRRHRRPGVPADLPRPAVDGAARPPRCPDHLRRAGRLDARGTARADAPEHRRPRRRRQRRGGPGGRAPAIRRGRISRGRDVRSASRRRSAGPSGRCSTSPSRSACSRRS